MALACGAIAFHANARRIEQVTFPSIARDAGGASVRLEGTLMLPPGPAPTEGRPAVVALHGCGGMYATSGSERRQLAERMALRGDLLVREGYAVLFVDSFRSRGVREVCTIRRGQRTIRAAQRELDALAALAYLASRKDVSRQRIALVGWSHGGSTALRAVDTGDPAVAAFVARPGAPPFFRAAVAFYPGCAHPLENAERYRPGAATRIYIGERDDWTPAATCVELGNAMAARGRDLLVTTYADSYHAFDSPTGEVVHRTDVPNGVHPGKGVHVGPNAAAREAANASVRAFLRERLH